MVGAQGVGKAEDLHLGQPVADRPVDDGGRPLERFLLGTPEGFDRWSIEEGRAYVFVAVEHANSEVVGIHAARSANRFEALEPVRQGVH